MEDIARAFSDGGIFMFIILLAGLLHSLPILTQLFLFKKADFTPYLWGGIAAIALLGALGSTMGLYQASAALGQAQPEQRAALLARGISVALNTSMLSAFFVLPGVFFTGIATSLTRNLSPVRPKPPKTDS